MPLKIVTFYNEAQRGFTETWYYPGSSDPQLFLNQDILTNYFKATMAIRNPLVDLYAVRASVIGAPRQSYTRILTGRYPGTAKPGQEGPDVTSTDGVWKIVGTNFATRWIFFRGLNDSDILRNATTGVDQPSPQLVNAVNFYFSVIGATLGWGVYQAQRAPAFPVTFTRVISVADALPPSNFSLLTLPAAPNLDLTSPVQVVFKGVPKNNLPGFPRLATVVAQSNVAPFSITIAYRYRANTVQVSPAKMSYAVQKYQIQQLPVGAGVWVFERESERKTGRPFGVPRGRAPVFVKAQ